MIDMSVGIFLISSAIAYTPMYRLLERVAAAKWTPVASTSTKLPAAESKQKFLNCLRHEAIRRVRARLAETTRPAHVASLPVGALQRQLSEIRLLMDPFCTRQTLAAFDRLEQALMRPDGLYEAINLRLELERQLSPSAPPSGTNSGRFSMIDPIWKPFLALGRLVPA